MVRCCVFMSSQNRGRCGEQEWFFSPTSDVLRGGSRPCIYAREGVGIWVQGQTSPASSCHVLGAWIQRVLSEGHLGKLRPHGGQWLALQVGGKSKISRWPSQGHGGGVCMCTLGSGTWVSFFLGTRCPGLAGSCVSQIEEGSDSRASLH